MDIVKELLALQDLEYKAHSSKINPTVPQETIIGFGFLNCVGWPRHF